jgi:ABC-type nitrate/sulfonate/bicarbonate transport system substrate-binding protein
MNHKRLIWIAVALVSGLLMAACAPPSPTAAPAQPPAEQPAVEETAQLTPVTFMLDWVPNTNHTGLFVAQDKGWFEEEGLLVDIIQPGEVLAEQAVASGAADFGISFQEQLTMLRADGVPLVSIAAIIQNNTSGFAARGELNVESPADLEGLRYGSWGSPFERPTLEYLLACDGGNADNIEYVDIGFTDPLALLSQEEIDFAWIFWGWQGIAAQQQGLDLDVVMMSDWFDCIPNYYTPVIITSQSMLDEHPETVRALMAAISRGYQFAIENPEEAAEILIAAAPEADHELVRESQKWLSERYAEGAPQWGYQQLSVWEGYADFMLNNSIIDKPIDAEAAFTNEFLPQQ